MNDGALASGGRPVCSARPTPPRHPTQIYFPITVPLTPCDRSYGDDDDGWLDGGGGGGGGSLDGARMAQGVSKSLS